MRIVPSLQSQRGYLLITVVVMLFLVASIAMLLNYDSAISANTSSSELEAARADYVAQAGMQHALWRAENNACMGDVTIPDTTLGNDTYSATITGAAAGTAYTLSPDQDAWIRNDDVTNNNGTTADQHLRLETGKIEQALTRFDLSSLPEDAQILSATAWFYVTASGPGGGAHPEGPLTVHRVTSDWTETGATWETMNGEFENSKLATIPAQPVDAVWVSFNLTGQVQAWANGQPNYGILMAPTAEGTHGKYSSREDGGNAPRLEVVVGSGAASPVTVKARGELNNGVKRALKDKIAIAYQSPGTTTLQLGTDPGADAMLDSFYPRNYGGRDFVQVNEDPGNWVQRPVFRFDLGRIPAQSAVLSAQLELRLKSLKTPGTIMVHRVGRSWVEGTKSGTGTADGATWATHDGINNWTSEGGDFDAAAVAEAAVDSSSTWVSWEVGPLVGQWLSGEPNNGLLLKSDGILEEAEFYSREQADATLRPRLTITYACECGSACMAPQGSGNVVMVVVNPTTLVPADAYKKALFESWGYTVDVISESANQAEYDAKAATSNAFFISETVNSNQVGNKLVNVSIGVVSQDGSYNSDLGLAGGSAWPVNRAINVTDASHYITAIFPAGPLDIYSAAMEQLTVSGGAAAGLQTLADTGGAGSLVALDTGAALLGSGSAAGRRVMLPLGREGRMNWDYLNGNGRLIVQRALAWGMGADAAGTGNVLLVVVNPASLTAQEAAKKALMESWGYTVSLIAEGASQDDFDAAVATADVAYVAEDIASGQLGTKLREATIGVVIEEEKITGEFGISSGETTFTEASIEVTDNTHYITQPFSLGAVSFSSSAQPVGGRAGTLAPGLAVLAERPSSSTSMLDVIDTGGALFDSGTAAGRRVKLPWGGNDFDINSLTDDGQTVMKRAIDWAAGSGCGSTTSLWMLVADANNPTAEENTRQTLLESWCYAVTLGTASEPLEVYDKYAENFDIVYVAASVNYADVGSKLKFQPIGVVAEPSILSSRLGFTSGTSGFTGTVTELTDDSHYITSGFSLGNLALTMTSTSLRHFTNTMGPGFKTLSVRPTQTDPMIMTLDTGDELLWGGQAPDRRVMLPWGGSSTFDVRNLTDDGLTILQRAIEWAGGAGPSPGHIAHWKLDETSGTTAVDSVGGHDGTLVSNPPWVTGTIGGGLDFDGVADYVDVGTFDVSGSGLTLMGWFNADSLPATTDPRIVSKASSTAEADAWWQLSILTSTSNANIRLRIKAGGTTSTLIDSSTNLNPGEWYFAVGTYNAATGQMKLYLDGIEVASQVHPTGGAVDTNPTVPVAIGANGSAEEFFDGVLDDVRVYNRALSASEIAALAAAGGGGGGGVGVVFQEYTDASASTASTSMTISTPAGTVAGDLLVAAIVTNGEQKPPITAPPGWTLIDHDVTSKQVTMDVLWKIANASEPGSYDFSWAKSQEAYGFIMRFTGHDPAAPIHTAQVDGGQSSSPASPAVITSVANTMIVRIGGFDDDDITPGAPGLAGHTPITMGASGSGTGTASGGAAHVLQESPGDSGSAAFALTASEEYRTVTIAIAPAP